MIGRDAELGRALEDIEVLGLWSKLGNHLGATGTRADNANALAA